MKVLTIAALGIIIGGVCLVAFAANARQDANGPTSAGARQTAASERKLSDIPGITTEDKTPHGCVDCHKNGRLPSTLDKWGNGVETKILEKAKAAAPEGKVLSGKHPDVSAQIVKIPDDCLRCHGRDSQMAPPFAKLMHTIHLTGGKDNHFLAAGGGTCTSCHKMDQKTGAWHNGSGEAK